MSQRNDFLASYLIETPFPPEQAAEVLAGEQSSGTFVRVEGETDALRDRFRAKIVGIEPLETLTKPTLDNDFLRRRGISGPYRRAIIRVSFPEDNVGTNLPTLAATVAGNIYDLGELTAVRLLSLELPQSYARGFDRPRQGIAGTRRLIGIEERPIIGTIVKPNIGLSVEDTASLVGRLCEAGVDFIKDDEVMANPPHAPVARRAPAIMRVIDQHAERSGKKVMYAFNITDETDAMRRHADAVAAAGGTCVMASVNWVGFGGMQTLRRHWPHALHAHRNGWAMMSRHSGLGMSFEAYQVLCRLAGIDQLHVNGLSGKFWEPDESVIDAARACLKPIAGDDAVLPVFSSGQWAGTVARTYAALASRDLIFLAGGGIIGHPDGAGAGVTSIREAWDAAIAGTPLAQHARSHPALARAIEKFGSP
ncbi:MAG: ribulose-bisphosphate carboxylase large subunit family protein [Alphaproteobacteria bacterium]|nr:ribulose-bisphosphate carboxylase large subunit family protein [Alphaproteobacteria bacterium]